MPRLIGNEWKDWLKYAEEDRIEAHSAFNRKVWREVCFHAQQARDCETDDYGVLWDGRRVYDIIKKYIKKLREDIKIKAAVIIGSRARGDWKPWSDIDLLIVVEKDSDKRRIMPGIVDTRVYTLNELRRALKECEIEVIEAFEVGKVIYNDGVWQTIKDEYLKVKERYGIQKYGKGWRVTLK